MLACSLGAEPEGVLRSLVGCKEGHVRWREQCMQSVAVRRTAPSLLQPNVDESLTVLLRVPPACP